MRLVNRPCPPPEAFMDGPTLRARCFRSFRPPRAEGKCRQAKGWMEAQQHWENEEP